MAEPKMIEKGKWRLRFRYKDPITNTWESKMLTGPTKKAVKEAEIEFLSKVSRGESVHQTNLLDFFDEYVDTFKRGKVSNRTLRRYLLTRKNLQQFFGDQQTLLGVTKLSYQKFLNWLGSEGGIKGDALSTTTVKNRHEICKAVFLEAVDMRYIHSNPARNAKLTGVEPEHDKNITISYEETKKFRATLLARPDTISKYFVLAQLYTGCRYQEIAALFWSDLDEKHGVIKIQRAYQNDEEDRGLGDTKTPSGIRDVDVPYSLFMELKKHKKIQNERVILGKVKNPRNLIFVNEQNTWPISNDAVNDYIEETCKLAGLPRITSHAFRHARADAMILAEADPIYIKNQLGHKNISQSYEYASATKDNRNKNKKKVFDYMKDIL
ncbi:site-specific integrase [Enterococcus devriesei]|uniref:tyrosine-type recombinase/integrase n=1 Tax=Enterococcus devriesei TaxID=319970 RepID=UPI001C125935|nr:site-specific integrase [Enterococcus devriesei]MBU5364254.1 site-specific integrase [Enterococcus devriesei]